MRAAHNWLLVRCLLFQLICLCPIGPRAYGEKASANIEGRTVILGAYGVTFQVPESWIVWRRKFKNNFHLTKQELANAKQASGEWDREYAEVINQVIPFDDCVAHLGGEGWGKDAVSYGDLQMRAYFTDLTREQIASEVIGKGVASAFKLSDQVSVARSQSGKWQLFALSFPLFYGDYGGDAVIDIWLRDAGKQTAALVFMRCRSSERAKIDENAIVGSFDVGK